MKERQGGRRGQSRDVINRSQRKTWHNSLNEEYDTYGVTSTSIYSSVCDNSEDSESPWPLKVWARLEGQIRNEGGSQNMPFSQRNGGWYRKPEHKHLPGMKTII